MAGQLNPKYKEKYWAKFKYWCHEAVVRGYRAMLENPAEFKEWKEEKISARLLHEMRKDSVLIAKNICVSREHYLEDEEILYGDKEAAEADRIDFSFESTWQQKEYISYFGEAKNLSAKDWTKKSGKGVKAWNQREYYFTTGIQGILFGKYKELDSFLIGYLVNGSSSDNLSKLNTHIQNRRKSENIGHLEISDSINGFEQCYLSANFLDKKEIKLLHLFLEFDR